MILQSYEINSPFYAVHFVFLTKLSTKTNELLL